jgi:endonuclease/exonuclease/phosphatase family metal-dependent hydrolase
VAIALLVALVALGCSGGNDDDATDGQNPTDVPGESPESTVTTGAQTLVIIDQNILHGIIDEDPAAEPNDRIAERIELIAAALGDLQPDIILFQEVVGHPGPDYPNIRQIVLDALGPGYEAVFGNFLGGPIEEEGLGQMTFTNLPIIESENRSVSEIRSVQHIALQGDAGLIDVYNAHLEGTGAVAEVTGDASIVEIENVVGFINETRDPAGAVIVGGDFNAEPDDPAIQRFLQEGFIDALADAGDATCEQQGDVGCTSGTIPLGDNPENLTDHRIDYIFVLGSRALPANLSEAQLFLNEPMDIGGSRTLWASDHIGIHAVVELGGD